MSSLRKIYFSILIATCLIAILLVYTFFGVYSDREFGDAFLFVKHRPYAKFFFYPPLGEADRSYVLGKEGYLTPEMEKEESLYIEFIEKNRGYERSIPLL